MLRIGTCSWKYDSWRGIFYDEDRRDDYLRQYAVRLNTVEIDRWFWSLFSPSSRIRLPEEQEISDLFSSVGSDFRFTVKVPNSITLTHYYQKDKRIPLQQNPHFLSVELFNRFLRRIEPLIPRIGALMFQFEYLNRKKMPSMEKYHEQMGEFLTVVPREVPMAVEIRNPGYIHPAHFQFLRSHQVAHVFVQGYYMPSIFQVFNRFYNQIQDLSIIRLMGKDRQWMEKRAGGRWDRLINAQDSDLDLLIDMTERIMKEKTDVYINVNNHYEGSAPLTIERIQHRLHHRG